MSNKAARVAATPTALVASLAGGGRSRSLRGHLPHVSVPNPVDAVLSGRRRRRRRQKMMRLARNAGAVVSAVTFAADLVHTLEDLKGGGSQASDRKGTGSRSGSPAKRSAGSSKGTGRAGTSRGAGTASRSSGTNSRSGGAKKTPASRAHSSASSNGRH